MGQQFRNIVYGSDRSGTFKWRRAWQMAQIDCLAQALNIQADYSQTPVLDQNYYNGVNSITVQRWISDWQRNLFCNMFKPLMDQNQGWTIYEIDDFMFDGTFVGISDAKKQQLIEKYGDPVRFSIPRFNRGRAAFEGQQIQENIKTMLNAADFVTVTTDYLKHVYHDIYEVPLENIIAIPNLLPRYLFSDRYDKTKKLNQFKNNRAKPRIGIVSSLSHYNVDGVREDQYGRACRKQKKENGDEIWINELKQEVPFAETREITDDIDAIADCIRNTVNDVQWVFFGYCPNKLKDLADSHKIEVHGGVPIMNYASKFDSLGLQAVVAAINPIGFNFCKSFIKTMECAALGIPCFATRCLPYNRVMPDSQMFTDGNELKKKITDLKFMSSGAYEKLIERQWAWLNTPCKEGDFNIQNFWMEDNLQIFIDLFRLRQKSINVSLEYFKNQYNIRKQKEKENLIFKNDNITITK